MAGFEIASIVKQNRLAKVADGESKYPISEELPNME